MNRERMTRPVIGRLPSYARYLTDLEERGVTHISSQRLGDLMGLTPSQIRQDINCFGGCGQHGYGYDVRALHDRVKRILGIGQAYHCVIVGAGNIARAVQGYAPFRDMGFSMEALFDSDAARQDETRAIPIYPAETLPAYLAAHRVDIGVIAVPESAAQGVCDVLISGGVEAIWNFAPVDLVVPANVVLQSVHLSDTLLVLSYYMNDAKQRTVEGGQR